MSFRIKLIFYIILISIGVVLAGVASGTLFINISLERTIESDMNIVAQIADHFISAEINLMKANAAKAARALEGLNGEELLRVLREQTEDHNEFTALTIFDKKGLVASWGLYPTPAYLVNSGYMMRAFAGEEIITTTRIEDDMSINFHVCVPVEKNRILSATLPGLYFNNALKNLRVWESGGVILIDKTGVTLADSDESLVKSRYDILSSYGQDGDVTGLRETVANMVAGRSGVGKYRFRGESRICVYRPLSGSRSGWSLGVVAPVDESPLQQARMGLFLVGLVNILLAIIAAVLSAYPLARPYDELDKARKAALASAEAKTTFLANMSHEMRTPLNAIIGLSELSLNSKTEKREAIPEETGENLEKIYSSGINLLGIINDLLDMSKIESGNFRITPVIYDVPSVINDTAILNMTRIGEKPISFNLHINGNIPSKLCGDDLRVKQIFNNLLSNAFKYTKKGAVDLYIETEKCGEDNFWLCGRVSDTGLGIKNEDMEKIFSLYGRVDPASNREIEGTGLGLSITRRLVEMMGGDISVSSHYGQGSTFSFRILQGYVNDSIIGDEVAESLGKFQYIEHKRDFGAQLFKRQLPYARVLVVDDVATNLDVTRGMMQPYGMQVDCVSSGAEAVARIRDGTPRYNAIFMDHMMPEMDGIEATRIIREEIGSDYAKNIPIIALTANAVSGNEKMFLARGFQAFLSKPIDILRMDSVINQWVRDRQRESSDTTAGSGDNADSAGSADNAGSAEKASKNAAPGIGIKGLDAAQGIARFSGNAETYLDILRSFARNTPPLLEKIDGFEETAGAGAAGKVHTADETYRVIVHGIKSSSRSIGAMDIGKEAEKLEFASQNGDREYIRKNNPVFIESCRNLIADISDHIMLEEEKKPLIEKPDPLLLGELASAAEQFDIDGVDNCIKKLEQYSYKNGKDILETIRQKTANLEFTDLSSYLKQFTGEAA